MPSSAVVETLVGALDVYLAESNECTARCRADCPVMLARQLRVSLVEDAPHA